MSESASTPSGPKCCAACDGLNEVGRVVRARERENWLSVGCSSVGCSRGVRVS